MSENKFIGVGWQFPPTFQRHAKAIKTLTVSDEQDIRESLQILLGTRPGERVMNPTYGSRIASMMFDNINESQVTELKDAIERAILFFEPRITLTNIDIDSSDLLNGRLLILLDYIIRTTNARSNMVYPFYLIEGNHVRL